MDLITTIDGDIYLDGGEVSQSNIYDLIGNRINHILRSKPGDWEYAPSRGANIQQYIGYPNIPSTKALIEKELFRALSQDEILGMFDLLIYYTPATSDSAIIEIKVKLPDGSTINVNEILQTNGAMVGRSEAPFTAATYDFNDPRTISEMVTLYTETNIFELKHLPFDNSIFIVPEASYNSGNVSEDGFISLNAQSISSGEENISYSIDWDSYTSGLVPYFISGSVNVLVDGNLTTNFDYDLTQINVSGYCVNSTTINYAYDLGQGVLSGQVHEELDSRQFKLYFDPAITATLKAFQKESLNIYVDGDLVLPQNYNATYEFVELSTAPKETFEVEVIYYQSTSINNVLNINQPIEPTRLFTRSRLSKKIIVIASTSFPAGKYYVQYTSGQLGL